MVELGIIFVSVGVVAFVYMILLVNHLVKVKADRGGGLVALFFMLAVIGIGFGIPMIVEGWNATVS